MLDQIYEQYAVEHADHKGECDVVVKPCDEVYDVFLYKEIIYCS